jgi:hypothetical protein
MLLSDEIKSEREKVIRLPESGCGGIKYTKCMEDSSLSKHPMSLRFRPHIMSSWECSKTYSQRFWWTLRFSSGASGAIASDLDTGLEQLWLGLLDGKLVDTTAGWKGPRQGKKRCEIRCPCDMPGIWWEQNWIRRFDSWIRSIGSSKFISVWVPAEFGLNP